MPFTIKDYADAIYYLNIDYLENITDDLEALRLVNSFAWGLVEEVEELQKANTLDSIIKEAGDVFAYGYLVLRMHLTQEKTIEELENIYKNYLEYENSGSMFATDDFYNGLALFSNMKRVNREREQFNFYPVFDILENTLNSLHGTSLETVLKTNVEKLTERKNRGTMFKGRGDNR